jgi:DNA adenine methylase
MSLQPISSAILQPHPSPKPILKWAGGKQGIAEVIIGHFPIAYDRYFEPFVGGCSVLLNLRPGKAVIGDRNDWLLDTYVAVRRNWRRVASILEGMNNTPADYDRYRAIRPDGLDSFGRAALLIYLNKTCFRGLYRVNKKGQFNVPYGAYNRRYFVPANFEAFAAFFHAVEIRYGDFEIALDGCREGDFAYLDPPYYKFGGYADFNRYTPAQFRAHDHIRLAAVCNELTDRKVKWALSNSDTPFVRSLFKGCKQIPISNRREINLMSTKRDIRELLITNY